MEWAKERDVCAWYTKTGHFLACGTQACGMYNGLISSDRSTAHIRGTPSSSDRSTAHIHGTPFESPLLTPSYSSVWAREMEGED